MVEEEINKKKYLNNVSKDNLWIIQNNYRIEWIEKLLQTPIEDNRKYCLWRILCPYLINVKKLSYDESFSILKDWLERCNQLRKLEFSTDNELRIKLKKVKHFYPISKTDLIDENKEIYNLIKM